MYYAVVMVAAGMKHFLQPIAQRVFGIGIFRAIHMQTEVHANEQVRKIAELKLFKTQYQKTHKQKGEYVFQYPVAEVGGAGKGADPYPRKNEYEGY